MSTSTAAPAGKIQPRLKQKYRSEIQQKLREEFGKNLRSLEERYQQKLDQLKSNLELRRKVEVQVSVLYRGAKHPPRALVK